MKRFIESICYEKGQYPLLHLHQRRVNATFAEFFSDHTPIRLSESLPIPDCKNRCKIRLIYSHNLEKVEWSEYQIRPLHHIQIIETSLLDYAFKYENRKALNDLYAQRNGADEILIVENEMITDSFYANVAFWDGDSWYTPSTCLLNGVRRQYLIQTGKVKEISISKEHLKSFEKISLFNAMLDLGESTLPVSRILK